MIVKNLEVTAFAIPLRRPAKISTRNLLTREYVLVKVITDEDLTGIGYIYAGTKGALVVKKAIEEFCTPLLVNQDPTLISSHWDAMFQESLLLGRRGVIMRAISCVDIALWDLFGKLCNQPLYRLLGGKSNIVPAYASGGYYKEGKGLSGLEHELGIYKDMGFTDFKIKVGGVSLEEDIERVRVARSIIGKNSRLALDANNGYTLNEARKAARSFEEFDIWFLEEPLIPDDIPGHGRLAEMVDVPIATGEIEATRFGFRDLILQKSISILQPDAGVLGGITEWMRVAHTASSFGIQIAPHWHHNLHAHLVGAITNGLTVEYFFPDEDIYNFEQVLVSRMKPVDGKITILEKPGIGLEIDKKAIERFKIN